MNPFTRTTVIIFLTLLFFTSSLFCSDVQFSRIDRSGFNTLPFLQQTGESDSLSIGQARLTLLKSVAFPGWGEHSVGYNQRGYILNSADIVLWVAYAALKFRAGILDKNRRAYAALHAEIDPAGKSEVFLNNISNYDNIYEYNDQKLRYRDYNSVYEITDKYFWSWDSDDSRLKFDKMRINHALLVRNASFVVGALVVNRIISVIDIISLTRGRLETSGIDMTSSFSNDGFALKMSFNIK